MGHAILFFHGLESGPIGRKSIALREAGFEVEAPDFGRQTLPERVAQAEDVTAGREGLVIVGSSFGGAVAVVLADRHPERIAGLVLCAPALRPELVGTPERVPSNTIIVHGLRDAICPFHVSEEFARRHGLHLVQTDDDHRLIGSIEAIVEAVRASLCGTAG